MRAAVAWYRRDQWERLRDVVADPEMLEDSYDAWVSFASRRMSELRREGVEPVRLFVEVKALEHWCRANGRDVDGAARAAYASQLLSRHASAGESGEEA